MQFKLMIAHLDQYFLKDDFEKHSYLLNVVFLLHWATLNLHNLKYLMYFASNEL